MNLLFLDQNVEMAGSVNSICYLTRGLAERGHRVFLGCLPESPYWDLLSGTAVRLLPMHLRHRFSRKNILEIKDAVRQYQIELINAQSSNDRYTAALARWWYKLPVKIVHTRRQMPMSIGGPLQNWFYTRGSDRIVAVSQGVKDGLVKKGLPASHIDVIYNGTPREKYNLTRTDFTQALRTQYQLDSSQPVVGCIARRKQQEQILEALLALDFPVTVLLVGISSEPLFEKITARYTLPHRLICTGPVPPQEVLYYYGLLDVKVLPSIIEGLSQALLEAMALGVPVIATRAGGNPELIQEGKNGFLFDEGDTTTLAQHLSQVLQDPALRQALIQAGHTTAFETFSITRTIDHYEAYFKELLAG